MKIHGDLRGTTAAVGLVVPVVLLAFAVRQQSSPIITADNAAIRTLARLTRTHELMFALLVVQQVTQPVMLYSACTVAVVWVAVTKRLRGRSSWTFVTMMAGWAMGGISKLLAHRVRPVEDEPLSQSPGYSFPPGHAFNIAVAGSVMVVLVWPLLERSGRWLAVGLPVVAGGAVGLDWILLGVHYPSDVIAGWLLGLGITVASWLGFTGRRAAPFSPA